MKTYRSKIDWWLLALILVPMVTAGVAGVRYGKEEVLLSLVPPIIIVAYVFSCVKYTLNDGILNVKAGFLVNQDISVEDIKSVTKTFNPLSAPALSINRLEIKYGSGFNYTLISPKNRQQFIADLLAINPSIIVKI